MNSNQRSQDNNQTDNMANEKSVSSSRGGTTENYSKQSSAEGTGMPGGGSKKSDTTPPQGGSRQSQDSAPAGQQPLADGLSQQAQGRPDLQSGAKPSGQSKGGSTLYGTGQGQHAQSSGGHEGADTRDQPMKEGAGMPVQGDVGRSAQTGGSGTGLEGTGQSAGTQDSGQRDAQRKGNQQSGAGGMGGQPQGGGKMGQASQAQGEDRSRQSSEQQGGASRDSSAGSAQLSGSSDSANTDNTGRAASQTGNQQMGNDLYDDVGNQRYSNDSAGGMPRSPAGSRMGAEQDMNDDTGLSNTANKQQVDMGTKQEQQSNVGRRSDGTPD